MEGFCSVSDSALRCFQPDIVDTAVYFDPMPLPGIMPIEAVYNMAAIINPQATIPWMLFVLSLLSAGSWVCGYVAGKRFR